MTFVGICRKSLDCVGNRWKSANILCFENAHANRSWPYVGQNLDKSWRIIFWKQWMRRKYHDKTWWTVMSSGLTPHLISAPVTFRSSSPHFTVILWFPQMLPNFDYGRQIMHTAVKKQGLPQMSANRPSIWFTRIDFPAEIVKSPEILSHLLLMVAIFSFPCAVRFPKSNHQISRNPISSAFSGRYFSLHMCH